MPAGQRQRSIAADPSGAPLRVRGTDAAGEERASGQRGTQDDPSVTGAPSTACGAAVASAPGVGPAAARAVRRPPAVAAGAERIRSAGGLAKPGVASRRRGQAAALATAAGRSAGPRERAAASGEPLDAAAERSQALTGAVGLPGSVAGSGALRARPAARVAEREPRAAAGAPPAAVPPDPRALRAALVFEEKLGLIARGVRLLPALTARNAAAERVRLQAQLERGEYPRPEFEYAPPRRCVENLRFLDTLRSAAAYVPGSALYLAKLDELELDLTLLGSLGDPRRVRPLSARRFGRGDQLVDVGAGPIRLVDHARQLLAGRPRRPERLEIPAAAEAGAPSLCSWVEAVAAAAGLSVTVRVEPNLTAGAATGDRTVFVADRRFGRREALRLSVHEVLGHLTAAANGRAQPLRILEWGTAFAFADQEGVALCLEATYGLLDRGRLRSLAGRVVATELMHEGASFGEAASRLYRDHAFGAAEAIAISERAYRGGGIARDCGYLLGYLRVSGAVARGETSLDELRSGRIGVAALADVRALVAEGLLLPPRYRPNLSRSFFSTSSGTMPWRSPPRAAASLINVELT